MNTAIWFMDTFMADLAFCDFIDAYAVSSFWLGQFSLNNY